MVTIGEILSKKCDEKIVKLSSSQKVFLIEKNVTLLAVALIRREAAERN
jgi:hypothetical protein